MNASPRTSTPAVLAAVLIALSVALTPIGPAQAAEGDVNWTVRTASNDFGAERTSYRYTVNPGAAVTDALTIANHGSTALDLSVYAADGYTTDSGQFDLLVGGADSVNVGAWIDADSDRISIDAGETIDVPFSLVVPENATPGDYAGGIVTSLVEPDQANGINVDRRLGIRIALRVAGDLVPGLTAEDATIDWGGGLFPFSSGDGTVTYTLRNTGNAVVSAQQSVSVTGPFGWFPADVSDIEETPPLLPGETWEVSVPARGIPPVVLLTGAATITPVVTDASGSTTTLAPVTVTMGGWAVPWLLLLLVVALVALALLLPRITRRRHAAQREREDRRVEEAVQRALRDAQERQPQESR